MNRNLSLFAFILGLIAVVWITIGYIGGSVIALAVSIIIALVYVTGALEMRRFQSNTAALATALRNIPDDIGHLGEWLQQVPVALQNAVRLRIEGERGTLPGPGMTPYLVGLLVLLGMIGTFLGMVVTLNGAVLALESTTDLQTIRSALAAPVRGLGVAFGTSVAGVATSAMLGLISALSRRDRLQVGQLLDSKIASVLREFSMTYQRQETFKALQAQASALPELVGKLDAMMTLIAEQNRQLGDRLQAGQAEFYGEAKTLYGNLAQSVDQSLKASLKESAMVAAESIQPVVTATMSGIAGETRGLHDKLFAVVEKQLAGIADQFGQTVSSVSKHWTQALNTHEQTTATQHRQLQEALNSYADTFDRRSATLLTSIEASQAKLQSDAAQQHAALAETSATGQQQLAKMFAGQLNDITGRTAALLDEMRATQAAWQAEWTAGEQARQARFADALTAMAGKLETQWQQAGQATLAQQEQITQTLGETAHDLVAATQRQADTTIAEVTRLMQHAAEAPKAAAEVIGQLRQELSASIARDNTLLEERSRIMETLGALLDAINHASTEQRGAIEGLISSSTRLLERVGGEFAEKVEREAGKLVEIGSGLTGGALEIASMGEAFGHAVQLFSTSNDKMMTALQRIEGALAKSLARSDEQLAYYVAQAREIIDLSIMSQKKMVDDLQRAAKTADEA